MDRIAKIIHGLKNYSRNSENDPFENIDVQILLNDTLVLCRNKFSSQMIELKIHCPTDLFIQCKAAQISQVLMNLFGNSFDAIESLAEKWIQITILQNEDGIQFAITDSGSGINPSILEKIMKPFYTTKPVGKGTGLGLSISKAIAENHGGSLKYLANEKNTTFILELPAQQKSNLLKAS